MKKQELISKMNQFLQADHDDMFESLESAFRTSMTDVGSHATCLWIEDGEIESEIFTTDALAIAEMARHDVAFFVPKSWHEKNACDWIWVEKDENPESETFGEELWCCSVQVMGVSGEVARFSAMTEMWDTLLDYVDNDWSTEAIRVIDFMSTWEEPAKTLIHPTTLAPAPEYGDQSPLLPVINVYFDHQNTPLDEIETLQDAILAMDIDHSMDCGFTASDVWHDIERGATPLTFGDIFTPVANDLQRLGMLADDGYLEISAEYTAILISLGVKK